MLVSNVSFAVLRSIYIINYDTILIVDVVMSRLVGF